MLYLTDWGGNILSYNALTGAPGLTGGYNANAIKVSGLIGPDDVLYYGNMNAKGQSVEVWYAIPGLTWLAGTTLTTSNGAEEVWLNHAFVAGATTTLVGNEYGDFWSLYNQGGVSDWRYSWPTISGMRGGAAILMDGAVAALRFSTGMNVVKFTPQGTLVWTQTLPGAAAPSGKPYESALSVGPDGTLFAANKTEVALNPSTGAILWQNAGVEEVNGITPDTDGSTYIARLTSLRKVSPSGVTVWTITIGGGAATEIGAAILTANGRLLVEYKEGTVSNGLQMIRAADG